MRAIIAQTIVRVLYFIFFLSIVSFLISIFIARTLTRPTLALISTAKRFSRGDHTARAHISSQDEIGELAGVFNEMAGTLESYTENLEGEVRERTKQLNEKIATLNGANIPVVVQDFYDIWFNDLTGHYILIPLNL